MHVRLFVFTRNYVRIRTYLKTAFTFSTFTLITWEWFDVKKQTCSRIFRRSKVAQWNKPMNFTTYESDILGTYGSQIKTSLILYYEMVGILQWVYFAGTPKSNRRTTYRVYKYRFMVNVLFFYCIHYVLRHLKLLIQLEMIFRPSNLLKAFWLWDMTYMCCTFSFDYHFYISLLSLLL